MTTGRCCHASVGVKLLFDVYTVQQSEGDLIARIEAHGQGSGYAQIAGVSGGARPRTGAFSLNVNPVVSRSNGIDFAKYSRALADESAGALAGADGSASLELIGGIRRGTRIGRPRLTQAGRPRASEAR